MAIARPDNMNTKLPSRDLPQESLWPYCLPIIEARLSETIKINQEVMAFSLEKKMAVSKNHKNM